MLVEVSLISSSVELIEAITSDHFPMEVEILSSLFEISLLIASIATRNKKADEQEISQDIPDSEECFSDYEEKSSPDYSNINSPYSTKKRKLRYLGRK
jgi:hypothetical protein